MLDVGARRFRLLERLRSCCWVNSAGEVPDLRAVGSRSRLRKGRGQRD